MITAGILLLLGAAMCASLFTAWTICAGSSGSTPFAPAVGANAISTLRAAFVVGIFGFLGAVLQGGNVTEAIGPLLPLLEDLPVTVPLVLVLLFGGFGLLMGSWMAASRMIKALARDYSELGPRRSIAVLVPSFAIAPAGIVLGVPMALNEIFVSAIVGPGYSAGQGSVSRSKMADTVLAWIGSLVAAFAISYSAYRGDTLMGLS